MGTFKYYRRGQGELDTSNFKEIFNQGYIVVEKLDEKTYVSLMSFAAYCLTEGYSFEPLFPLKIKGYVYHMRADKDLYDPAIAYELLWEWFDIHCYQIQHDSRYGIVSATIDKVDVLDDLNLCGGWYTQFIGADSSVPKFFPSVDSYATKVRENGKVVSLDYTVSKSEVHRLIIVDDLLGGGATVQMLVDKIKESGYTGEILLWVQYNEGIHSEEFINQFDGYYIGDDISK